VILDRETLNKAVKITVENSENSNSASWCNIETFQKSYWIAYCAYDNEYGVSHNRQLFGEFSKDTCDASWFHKMISKRFNIHI